MDSQICECEHCLGSYDSYFGSCGQSDCHQLYVICENCFDEYAPAICNGACPYCAKNNDVMNGIYNGTLEPLYKAISEGQLDYYGQPSSVDYRLPFGMPVIDIVAGQNNIELLTELLEGGANPNTLDCQGWCALFSACQAGDSESFKLLISYGASPHVVSMGKKWEDYWVGTENVKEELREYIKNSIYNNIKGE